ncbi:hypothetical protein OROHE_003890 [Orobanche hederae]
MSWQSYVDDHLMCVVEGSDGATLTDAAIIGHDGSVWAQSSSFPKDRTLLDPVNHFWANYITGSVKFKAGEFENIVKDFEEPGSLAPTGLHLEGVKYMVIQGEPNAVIRGKKGSGGITIKKTGQALIFGIYEEPVTPGQCNMLVEKLGDYLIEQGL